jgi:hypothetical protein
LSATGGGGGASIKEEKEYKVPGRTLSVHSILSFTRGYDGGHTHKGGNAGNKSHASVTKVQRGFEKRTRRGNDVGKTTECLK